MSDALFPSRAADEISPPMDAGVFMPLLVSVTTSAQNVDLNQSWGNVANRLARGGAYFSFQSRGGTSYVRFKSTTSAAGTTSGNGSNGVAIPDDGKEWAVYLYPNQSVLDVIGSASLTLVVRQSSPNPGSRT